MARHGQDLTGGRSSPGIMALHSPRFVVKFCPYCQKQHRPETRTCPMTGKSLDSPTLGKTQVGLAAPPSLAMPAGFPRPEAAMKAEPGQKTSSAAAPPAKPVSAAPPAKRWQPRRRPSGGSRAAGQGGGSRAAGQACVGCTTGQAGGSRTTGQGGGSRAARQADVAPCTESGQASLFRFATGDSCFRAGRGGDRACPASRQARAGVPRFLFRGWKEGPHSHHAQPSGWSASRPSANDVSVLPPAPQPSVVESREDPAGAVRVKPDAPVTPYSAPLPPTEASVSARPSAPEPPPAARAPVAALDEGVTAVERVAGGSAGRFRAGRGQPAPAAARPCRPAGSGGMALRQLPWWARLSADALDGLRLLAEAGTIYWRNWRPLLLLVAILLLPVTAAKSCMVAAVMGSAAPSPLVDGSAATVDFSRARQELSVGRRPAVRKGRSTRQHWPSWRR